ncbi:DUF4149 domain-containing protein [Comamonadaceae bacterium OH2545_COT-014]|nr:DUF4149 domain-containing protein [Comamonadaceae bacterium OH2545_COT-014]
MAHRLALFAAALWWGSLTAIGFMAVPLLFTHLPMPALAGNVAGRLFSAEAWMAMGCGVALLLALKSKTAPGHALSAKTTIILVALGLLMALLGEFAVAPRIVARDNLRLWHSVGTVMYVVQWLCAAAVLWRLGRPDR